MIAHTLEILKYLIDNSSFESVFRIGRNELLLQFNNIGISVIFENINKENYEESYIDITEIDISLLAEETIEKIILQNGSAIYFDNESNIEYLDQYEPYTITTYEWVRKLKGKFPNSINKFHVCAYLVDDSCSMCDDIYDYGFQIEINEQYWDCIEFFKYIIRNNICEPNIPTFYDTKKLLKDQYELKYISTNTKTRRLGYLKILLSMFNHRTHIPSSRLNTMFERFCQNFDKYRLQHKNTKGNIIVTKNGTSAAPYVELALKLGILHKGGGIYTLGKMGKVYNSIHSCFDSSDENPFELNKMDILFWGELIIREDFWFIYSILEQAAINPNISYGILKKYFKDTLIEQIDNYINDMYQDNSIDKMKMTLIKRKISQWEKPEVYMEHILMPRLNWLFDLGFVSLDSNLNYSLTKEGRRLLFNMASWSDISLHRVCSPSSFIESYYMKMMNDVFESHHAMWSTSNTDILENYIEDGFKIFRTLAPNRITYSIFVTYLKYTMFIKNKIIIDDNEIRYLFENNTFPSYTLQYELQYKDGYIQKIKL